MLWVFRVCWLYGVLSMSKVRKVKGVLNNVLGDEGVSILVGR